jgi:tetratricopeptide (TPR) repeat protein
MIVHLFSSRQDVAGGALLEKAGPEVPERGLLHYRIGLAYTERSEPAKAVQHFEQALVDDPAVPDIRLSLGQALLASGRAREAVPHLQAA